MAVTCTYYTYMLATLCMISSSLMGYCTMIHVMHRRTIHFYNLTARPYDIYVYTVYVWYINIIDCCTTKHSQTIVPASHAYWYYNWWYLQTSVNVPALCHVQGGIDARHRTAWADPYVVSSRRVQSKALDHRYGTWHCRDYRRRYRCRSLASFFGDFIADAVVSAYNRR